MSRLSGNGRKTSGSLPRIDTEALRSEVSITYIVQRRVKLRRCGQDMEGLCPFHEERTPSFKVNEGKGTFFCFGCGEHGDVISFVMATENMEFLEAVRSLKRDDLPKVDPLVRRQALIRDNTERLAKIADAQALWLSAEPGDATPAGAYIRSRGITMPIPRSMRFAQTWAWKNYDTGETGPCRPALIGAVQDAAGKVMGVQRIFLKPDGSGKADMPSPKLSLGQLMGGAIRLGPLAANIIIIEGPEDGLTVAQALPDVPVWVACGTSMMPLVGLPDLAATVTLAGDNNAAGRTAVEAAGAAFVARGLSVMTMFPGSDFADFNDELRGIRNER